jgi:acetyl-CoA synthetase
VVTGVDAIIWRPRPDDLERSHAARLMRRHGIADAEALRRRAASDPEWFYPAILEDLGIEWFTPYHAVKDASRGLPWTDWFLGGRLNLVHNCLDRHVLAGYGEQVAVIAEDDDGTVVRLRYRELHERVQRFAGALERLGVGAGDAVGFYLPMCADVVVALLACLRIGAVAVPVFSGFGPEALATRLADAKAKVLLTADGTRRRGREVALKPAADHAAGLSGTVRHVVVLRRTGAQSPCDKDHDVAWEEIERVPLWGPIVSSADTWHRDPAGW